MACEFDKTLQMPYSQLADADKVCHQPADESTQGAIKVWDLSHFAPAFYCDQHKDTIVDVCKEWMSYEYSSWGISQDHDSGIHDVEHDEKCLEARPANCVLHNGQVVALVDD